AYVVAVLLRRELAGVPFADINLQARDAYVFWRGLVRYLKGFLEELVSLRLSRARVSLKKVLVFVLRKRCQNADPSHPLTLLCARRERPRSRRAAEQRDELAAFQSTTSSARAGIRLSRNAGYGIFDLHYRVSST